MVDLNAKGERILLSDAARADWNWLKRESNKIHAAYRSMMAEKDLIQHRMEQGYSE